MKWFLIKAGVVLFVIFGFILPVINGFFGYFNNIFWWMNP